MDAVTGAFNRVFRPGLGRAAATRTAGNRAAAIARAVAWWEEALNAREGADAAKVARFGQSLGQDLTARLEVTYRVYLEVVHQPKGVLRDAALAAELDLDSFPPGTTMAVGDAKVEVSRSAQAAYEPIYTA
jgi:hypothetical protein